MSYWNKIADGDVQIECYVTGNNAESLRPSLATLLEPELNWTISNISMIF